MSNRETDFDTVISMAVEISRRVHHEGATEQARGIAKEVVEFLNKKYATVEITKIVYALYLVQYTFVEAVLEHLQDSDKN